MATMQLELWDRETAPRVAVPARAKVERRREAPKAERRQEDPEVERRQEDGPPAASERGRVLESLRGQLARIESGVREAFGERISCGSPALDRMLPGGGLAAGTVTEWVAESEGCGAGWLSLVAARGALERSEGGRLVVIDGGQAMRRGESFYPPAAIAAGIPAEQIIVVRPAERGDFLWAADQALRNPAVAVVWGFLDVLDDRDARRLQLAAETGNSTAMFVRPLRALREPSWAEVRWHVRGMTGGSERQAERRLEARLVRCRGGRPGGSVILQIDSAGRLHHETSSNSRQTAALSLVAQLAHPAVASQPRRRRA